MPPSHSYLNYYNLGSLINKIKMTYQIKTHRIESLEPNKLSESIKSLNDHKKNTVNVTQQTYKLVNKQGASQVYEEINRRGMTQTQEIYGSGEARPSQRSFIKNQNNNNVHIDKLNQLKKQYEVLRNIKIDDSFIYEKVPKRGESQAEPSDNNSVRSIRTNSKVNRNNNGMIQYQKKQLELMLTNSMNKIEELLKAEVQYKRKIYELSRLNPQNTNEKLEEKLKNASQIEKASQQAIERLKAEELKLRNLNFNLTERIRSIQSQNFNFETQIRRTNDEKRKLEQNILLQKQSHMNTKIQMKKYQLERDMLQKQKNGEIQRLKRTINQLNGQNERLSSNSKKQQSQIDELKQKINKLIGEQTLKQIQKRQQKEQKDQKEQKPKSQPSHDQFQKRLTEKIKQLEKAEQEAIKNEINMIKQEVENMKEQNDQTNEQIHLETRIAALEKIINDDNEEKMNFLDELRRIIKDFQQLEMENEQLKEKLRKVQKQLSIEKENSAYQLDRLQKSQRISKTSSDLDQIHNYLAKIRKLQAENKDLKSKAARFEESMSNSESRVEQKIREYSKKLEDSELQIEKLQRQYQFNLEIAQAKYKSEIEITKNDSARGIKQRQEQKAKYERVRNDLQIQIQILKKEKDQLVKSYNQKLQQKNNEVQQAKQLSQNNQIKARQDYQKQLFSLLARLDQLIQSNQRYALENTKLLASEAELHQLRQRTKKMIALTEGVDHLWQVKEAQYYNVNMVLKQLKG